MATDQPTFLTVETHEGRATLGGKRRLLDDFEAATDLADQIDGQVFAIEPIEAAPFTPKPAIEHVRISEDLISAVPGITSTHTPTVHNASSQAGLHSARRRYA